MIFSKIIVSEFFLLNRVIKNDIITYVYDKRGGIAVSDLWQHTWAEVDISAVEENYFAVRHLLSDSCQLMAVVKADGYGHGAVAVAQRLLSVGADRLAVSNLNEALQLRKAGITAPILIFSHTPPEAAACLAKQNITQTVIGLEYAHRLEQAAAAANVKLKVHIKIDTGMSRVGFVYHDTVRDDEALEDIFHACTLPHLEAEGCFTHFSVADEPNGEVATRKQFSLFLTALEKLEKKGITFSLRHCCNSAATLRFSEMHLDMVRPGILLYGVAPSPWMRALCPLRPALSLKTRVSLVKTVPAETPVSYGATFVTQRETKLATVPIGYGDGLPRVLSKDTVMMIKGQQASLVGRVCMDQCLLDVTDIEGVEEGNMVTVFGDSPTVDEYAAFAGTISYESLCSVGKRVPRVML